MFSDSTGSRIMDGVSLGGRVAYKHTNSSVYEGEFYVVGDGGELHKPMLAYVYDTPAVYCLAKVELVHSSTYTLSGICTPVGSTVYATPLLEAITIQDLKNGVITSTVSNDEGAFSISDISGIDGTVIVWIAAPPSDAMMAGITCEATVTDTEETTGEIVMETFTAINEGVCPMCNGIGITEARQETCPTCGGIENETMEGNTCSDCGGTGLIEIPKGTCTRCSGSGKVSFTTPRFTVTGTCPTDIETIYMSEQITARSVDMDMNALSSNVCVSVTPTNGTYTLAHDCVADSTYVVWGATVDGGVLTVDNIVVSEGYVECLSGDTLITMADGSLRRLDSVKVGDMVMSKNGDPVRVYRISNGYFNPYHTLYTFEDGTIINETREHRFFNVDQGFWQLMKNWKIGDHAINQNGEKIALVSIERIEEEAQQFGIWTDSGSYYANGLLSGMAACNKPLLANATAEQAVDMMISTDELHLLQLIGLDGVLP